MNTPNNPDDKAEPSAEDLALVPMPKPMKASKVAEIRMKAISDKHMGTLLRELAFFVFYIAMLFLVSAGKCIFRSDILREVSNISLEMGSPQIR